MKFENSPKEESTDDIKLAENKESEINKEKLAKLSELADAYSAMRKEREDMVARGIKNEEGEFDPDFIRKTDVLVDRGNKLLQEASLIIDPSENFLVPMTEKILHEHIDFYEKSIGEEE